MQISNWDAKFIKLAEHVSMWSKDPSTKTGAVIVRPDKTVASLGFNGFPRKIKDLPELLNSREEKYKRVIHCELNAILSSRERLDGYTLYNWPGQSCSRCAVHVIQSGISRVVAPAVGNEFTARWRDEIVLAEQLFNEAGIELVYI
jgi:dCMP deaminase